MNMMNDVSQYGSDFIHMLESFTTADNAIRSAAEAQYQILKERSDTPLPFLLLYVRVATYNVHNFHL